MGGHGTQPRPGTRAACLARAPRSPAPSVNGRRASGCVRAAARPRPPRLVEPSEHVRAFTSFSYKCDFEAWPHGEDTLSPGLHHSIQLHVLVHVCVPVCLCAHACVARDPCCVRVRAPVGARVQHGLWFTERSQNPERGRSYSKETVTGPGQTPARSDSSRVPVSRPRPARRPLDPARWKNEDTQGCGAG